MQLTRRSLLLLLLVTACGGEGSRGATPMPDSPAVSTAAGGAIPSPARDSAIIADEPGDDASAISIYLHGAAARVLLVDPQGRRLGTDPRSGESHTEIPNGSTSVSTLGDEEGDSPVYELLVTRPLAGRYTVRIIGERDGRYALDASVLTTASASADATVAGEVVRGEVHDYRFDFAKTSATPTPALDRVP